MRVNRMLIALLLIGLVAASCGSSNKLGGGKKGCGCAAKKGMVGY